ncbi:hypothetical protein ABEB36_000566 [Hypothenemus hampei]|uniref:UDP-glucuronosyltransferase n=1 Tax=Hypothenemus hampei TaxID=57062 RepID=A0ABD1FEW1_HYPHA
MSKLSHILLTLQIQFMLITSKNILVYTPLPFYSHQTAYNPLWKSLARLGHNLTILTLNPMKETHENIHQVNLEELYDFWKRNNAFEIFSSGEQTWKNIFTIYELSFQMVDLELGHPEVKALINGDRKFDLVITEFYLTLGVGFAWRFNCSWIGVVSMDLNHDKHALLGNPMHPVLYPAFDLGMSSKEPLTFKQRFISCIYYVFWNICSKYFNLKQDALLKKHFGPNVPSLQKLEKTVSLVMTNSNPIFHKARPLGPKTINIGGGLQIAQSNTLPEEISRFLDKSVEGIIYFSLGSNIQSSKLSKQTICVLLETFAQLPYKILWKFDLEENIMKMPSNVFTRKWFPQQYIIGHPHVILFITQGGLQSLEEAVFNSVPVLVLPFFGDQFLNAQKVLEHGLGLVLDHKKLGIAEFKTAIEEIIENSRYKEAITNVSRWWLDRPLSALQEAAWWTEFVLRHHLEMGSNDKKLVQSESYFFSVFVIICLVYMLFYR